MIPGEMAMGGDIKNNEKKRGMTIYDSKFADENFTNKHTDRGILSMTNTGKKNANGCQF